MREKPKAHIILVLTILTAFIFYLDIRTPLGVADWALYPILLLLTLWSPYRHATWVVAAFASVLTVLGGLYSPPGDISDRFAFFNRIVGIGFIWVCALIIIHRKRAEESLNQALQDIHDIMETVPDVMYVINRAGNLIKWNKKLESVTGLCADELYERSALEFFPDEEKLYIAGKIQEAFTCGYAEAEGCLLTKSGTAIPHYWSGAVMKNVQGDVIGLTGVGRDITERKRTEEALQQSEERFRTFLEHAPHLAFVKATDGRYLYINRRFENAFGLSRSDVIGKTDRELLSRRQAELFEFNDRQVLEQDRAIEFEEVSEQIDGLHTSIVVKFPLKNTAGITTSLGGIAIDITGRIEAERKIETQARLLDQIFQASLDCIVLLDTQYNFIRVSESYARVCQRNVSDFPGLNHFELYPSPLKSEFDEVLRKGGIYSQVARPFTFPDHPEWGVTFWDLGMVPIHDTDGNVEFLLVTLKDVTERKRTEEARARLAAIVESSEDAIISLSLDGSILTWNLGAEAMFGYTAEEIIGKPSVVLCPPNHRKETSQFMERLGREHRLDCFETVRWRKDGREIHVSLRLSPIKDETGRIIGVSKIVRDITAHKRTEEALRNAHAELEERVQERTSQLTRANAQLQEEIAERRRAEEALSISLGEVWDLYNKAPCGYHSLDENGIFTAINDTELRWIGYRRDEVVRTMTFADLLTPTSREVFLQNFPLFKESGRVHDLEFEMVRKDGKSFPVLLSATAIKDGSENYVSSRSTLFDISEYKQAEEKFRLVVESAPWGILMADADGRIIMANLGLERLFGYAREELIGRPLEMLMPERFRYRHRHHRAGFFADSKVRPMGADLDLYGLRKDGSEFPVEVTLAPVQTKDGPAVASTIVDLTERRRAQEELQKHTRLLESANKELEAFSYSVSHDLRAPLRGINGFSMALLQDYSDILDEQGRDYLQRVCGATQRMEQLIDDLLGLSRVTRTLLSFAPVDMSEMAETVIKELQERDPDRQVDIVVTPGLVAYGDSRLLRVALENLLGNAWKFTSKQAHGRIEFGVMQSATGQAYFVRDNGAGFDMTHGAKLFGAFQRLHTVAEFPGTGIGLATVQRIIHRHGGRVWAEGAIDLGATFYFVL